MSSDDQQPDDPSRGDELLAELKQRVRPGQFRLGALFLATLVLAVLLAIPRMAGWTYLWCFQFLHMAAFALAPLVGLVAASLLPWLRRRNQILLAAACIALATVPTLIHAVWAGDSDAIAALLIYIPCVFWLPQIACIWGVWYFVFRKARG